MPRIWSAGARTCSGMPACSAAGSFAPLVVGVVSDIVGGSPLRERAGCRSFERQPADDLRKCPVRARDAGSECVQLARYERTGFHRRYRGVDLGLCVGRDQTGMLVVPGQSDVVGRNVELHATRSERVVLN